MLQYVLQNLPTDLMMLCQNERQADRLLPFRKFFIPFSLNRFGFSPRVRFLLDEIEMIKYELFGKPAMQKRISKR